VPLDYLPVSAIRGPASFETSFDIEAKQSFMFELFTFPTGGGSRWFRSKWITTMAAQ
jgi:hypothetical protein